jgi:hypothetical protein
MRIAWMHPDCLSDAWFTPDDQAVFIFDDAYLAASGWGLKRILFVYETLLELPVEIHRGSTLRIPGYATASAVWDVSPRWTSCPRHASSNSRAKPI